MSGQPRSVREAAERFGLDVGLGAKPDRASWLALADMGLLDLRADEDRGGEGRGGTGEEGGRIRGSRGRRRWAEAGWGWGGGGRRARVVGGRWVG